MRRCCFVLVVSFLLTPLLTQATHIRAGEIVATRLSCSSLTYRVQVIIYTNTESPTHPGGWFGGGTLRWGDGSIQVPQTFATEISSTLHIGRAVYQRDITFSSQGTFTISFEEAHRNTAILNIPNQNDDINFFVETQIKVSASLCDSTPTFLTYPIDESCKGQIYYHNPGATDVDGDSLSYSFTTPKGNGGITITGFTDPNNSKFYAGLDYNKSNSTQNGPPTFGINPITGLVTWDAPGQIGNYNIAIKVTQWKKNPVDSTWQAFGYSVRDMQITVLDCPNHPPTIDNGSDVCILAGELLSLNILGSDIDHDRVTIEVFSDITTFSESPATVKYVNVLQSEDTAHIKISWTPDCIRVREQPYQILIKIIDSPTSGSAKLTSFKTINVKVMGPPPDITDVQLNPATKKVTLTWDSYVCANANAIQVWRRVSELKYTQSKCEVGMKKSLNYVLLTELPSGSTTFTDENLTIGAQYCYRIVARFGNVGSKISLDTCLIPHPADAPVITHVTVNKTNEAVGEIQISWRSPFDIDKIQYPPPYQYAVQRGNGFEGGVWSTVTSGPISDTTYIDSAIPTLDTTYHYRIILYVPAITSQEVDTSSIASSVKLKSVATPASINLSWDALVPWSNFLESYPRHYIYRSEKGVDDSFELIDSVDVNEDGLTYVDGGKFQNKGLDYHTLYYYKIEATGGYGNPKIKEPLLNFSQVVFNHVIDTIPPCPPVVSVVKPNCEELPCTLTYSNTIQWVNAVGSSCQDDVVYYEVYVADSVSGNFILWNDHVADTVVTHNGLNDLSLCYKLRAMDWVGNKSQLSEAVCGENCPAISMPNVFTPENSENYNDTFKAFSATGNILNKECSRFIDYMSLTVVNRLGKEIITTSSENIANVYWDGKDDKGRDMPSGVYYFTADVRFKYSSEKSEMKKIKGWVMLVR